jgi:hypothetical protein
MGGLVPVEEIIPDIVSYFGQIWNLRNGLDKYIFQIQSDWNQLGTYTLLPEFWWSYGISIYNAFI